ncbi:hypothetical protein AVEN_233478-1 [Araneus ventricosus]|uniref:Uncharacterized protein n=1 Tax=Araneus ventricosus TaxID=182803 RepID=A0A4Y2FVU2_ARAVE|nr:hypothetical protein AVEN_233478-1 [Araneus ventricosus]
MTRTTPELAPPLQTFAPHQREGIWPLRMIWRATGPIHGGSSVESGFAEDPPCMGLGFEPGILRAQGRCLATRPPRPPFVQLMNIPLSPSYNFNPLTV